MEFSQGTAGKVRGEVHERVAMSALTTAARRKTKGKQKENKSEDNKKMPIFISTLPKLDKHKSWIF